jgi:hypothetical protein
MPEVNWIAIVVAAVASFLLGGLRYSPVCSGKAWQREVGLTDEQMKNSNMVKIFGLTLSLCLLAAWMFVTFGPRPSPHRRSVPRSRRAFLGASSFGIQYLFERRSLKLFLINGGYHTLQFTVIGGVISLLSS